MKSLFGGFKSLVQSTVQQLDDSVKLEEEGNGKGKLEQKMSEKEGQEKQPPDFEEANTENKPKLIAGRIMSLAKSSTERLVEKAARLPAAIATAENPLTVLARERAQMRRGDSGGAEEDAKALEEAEESARERWRRLLGAGEDARRQLLAISKTPENFLLDAPPMSGEGEGGMGGPLRIEAIAADCLRLDPELGRLRFALVPKRVSEQKFWANYAYRLTLVEKLVENNTSQKHGEKAVDGTKDAANNGGSSGSEEVEMESNSGTAASYEVVGTKKQQENGEEMEDEDDEAGLEEALEELLLSSSNSESNNGGGGGEGEEETDEGKNASSPPKKQKQKTTKN